MGGSSVPCFIIAGAWHDPHNSNPELFMRTFLASVERACRPGPAARAVADSLAQQGDIEWSQWATSFDCWDTEHTIMEDLYRSLTALYIAKEEKEEDYFKGI